jgi:uncharacterized protein
MKLNNINIVLFHKNCPDGFGSAWIVNYYLKDTKVEYFGLNPSFNLKNMEDILSNKNVLIVDLSFPKKDIKYLKNITNNFMIIDHHQTYYDDIKDLENVELNTKHSAIYLTWKKFFPKKKVPLFINYIEDNDIKGNKYQDTYPFSTALPIKYPFNNQKYFKKWEQLLNKSNVTDLIKVGKVYMDYKNYILDRNSFIIKNIYKFKNKKFNKFKVILVNKTIVSLNSDLAEYILNKNKKIDILILWNYIENYDNYSLILRTQKENIDLSDIAKTFNGGGHSKAAHFSYKKNINTLFDKYS